MKKIISILALSVFLLGSANAESSFDNMKLSGPFYEQEETLPELTPVTLQNTQLESVLKSLYDSFTNTYYNKPNTEETRQKIVAEYSEFLLLIQQNYDIIRSFKVVCDETNNVSSGTESSILVLDLFFDPTEFLSEDQPKYVRFRVQTTGFEI